MFSLFLRVDKVREYIPGDKFFKFVVYFTSHTGFMKFIITFDNLLGTGMAQITVFQGKTADELVSNMIDGKAGVVSEGMFNSVESGIHLNFKV